MLNNIISNMFSSNGSDNYKYLLPSSGINAITKNNDIILSFNGFNDAILDTLIRLNYPDIYRDCTEILEVKFTNIKIYNAKTEKGYGTIMIEYPLVKIDFSKASKPISSNNKKKIISELKENLYKIKTPIRYGAGEIGSMYTQLYGLFMLDIFSTEISHNPDSFIISGFIGPPYLYEMVSRGIIKNRQIVK